MSTQDYDLLIVSDLHLSEGRDSETKKLSLIEDFLFDEEFARFLRYHMPGGPSGAAGRKWRLIINGDFFDFLQVVSTKLDKEFLDYLGAATHEEADAQLRASSEHPEYGFGTGFKETVFKLWKIMDGHWLFFESLAEFVVAGNVVSIGRGNHDVELIYPQVRAAFIQKLRAIYEAKLTRAGVSNKQELLSRFDTACEAEAVSFLDWFYYEKELWVEHGNQYDELNSFRYWLAPYLPDTPQVTREYKGEIDLPWGSFFVRYLFNKIETKEPFADNIKPTTRFIAWLLKTHPFLALHFVFHNATYMLRKIARAWQATPAEAYADQERAHREQLSNLANKAGISEEVVVELDAQRARNILKEPYSRWKVYSWLTRHWRLTLTIVAIVLGILAGTAVLIAFGIATPIIPGTVKLALLQLRLLIGSTAVLAPILLLLRWAVFMSVLLVSLLLLVRAMRSGGAAPICYLAERARHIRDSLGVQYVVMGHTHDTDLRQNPSGGEYFNTGTWTKVFSEEERLIREDSELVFLRGTRIAGRLKMELMKWLDGAAEPRLVKLFADQGSETSTGIASAAARTQAKAAGR